MLAQAYPNHSNETAEKILDAVNGGAVIVCSPVSDSTSAVPTRVAVRSKLGSAEGRIQKSSRNLQLEVRHLSGADGGIDRRPIEIPSEHVLSWSRALGPLQQELQWLFYHPERDHLLAWVIVVEASWTPPLPNGFRRRLGRLKNEVLHHLRWAPSQPPPVLRNEGWFVADRRGFLLHYSPNLETCIDRLSQWLPYETDRLSGQSPFIAANNGALLRFDPLTSTPKARREDLSATQRRVRRASEVGGDEAWLVRVRPQQAIFRSPVTLLSPAQKRVAEYAVAGATAHEIARTMHASVETTRTHLREIYRRLDVGCRVELAELLKGS